MSPHIISTKWIITCVSPRRHVMTCKLITCVSPHHIHQMDSYVCLPTSSRHQSLHHHVITSLHAIKCPTAPQVCVSDVDATGHAHNAYAFNTLHIHIHAHPCTTHTFTHTHTRKHTHTQHTHTHFCAGSAAPQPEGGPTPKRSHKAGGGRTTGAAAGAAKAGGSARRNKV